jgi:hypothetical protein
LLGRTGDRLLGLFGTSRLVVIWPLFSIRAFYSLHAFSTLGRLYLGFGRFGTLGPFRLLLDGRLDLSLRPPVDRFLGFLGFLGFVLRSPWALVDPLRPLRPLRWTGLLMQGLGALGDR